MSRRRRYVVGAALVGVVGGALITRRLTKRPPAALTVVAVMLAAAPTQWWNPLSWFNAAGDLTSSVISDIEAWVKRAISLALQIYDDALAPVIHDVSALASYAEAGVTDLYGWTRSAVGWINNIITTDIPNAVMWGVGEAEGLARTLYADAVAAFDFGLGLVVDAVNLVKSSLSWLTTEIIDPLWQWVQQAGEWLAKALGAWWDVVWANVIAPELALLHWLWTNVPQWVEWLASEAYPWLQIVIKAGDWLLWFSEHSIDDLRALLNASPSQVDGAFLANAQASMETFLTEVDQWAAQVFGE